MPNSKVLNIESVLGLKVLEIEKAMDEAGIKITGNDIQLEVDDKEFKIGRDSTEFPRSIEEPFVLVE